MTWGKWNNTLFCQPQAHTHRNRRTAMQVPTAQMKKHSGITSPSSTQNVLSQQLLHLIIWPYNLIYSGRQSWLPLQIPLSFSSSIKETQSYVGINVLLKNTHFPGSLAPRWPWLFDLRVISGSLLGGTLRTWFAFLIKKKKKKTQLQHDFCFFPFCLKCGCDGWGRSSTLYPWGRKTDIRHLAGDLSLWGLWAAASALDCRPQSSG